MGLSPSLGGSDTLPARQSELNYIVGQPAGVTELLGVWKTHMSGVESETALQKGSESGGDTQVCGFP